MKSVTHDLSKNMFIVEMERVYPLNSDWKDRSDWLADSINLTWQASSGPISYDILLRKHNITDNVLLPITTLSKYIKI